MKYTGAIIADIHAGAVAGEILYKELKKGFIKYLKSMDKLDFVVIAGDLFDTKISLNSEHTKYILKFLDDLMDVCADKTAKLRILKGTESHDNQQLEVIEPFINNNIVDVKIINSVEAEYIYDDFHVLYIPEQYMKDSNEFYKPYFDDTYDMIFGHGMVNEVAFVAKSQQSEVTMNHAPIFKTETLLSVCMGPVFFGHIHKPQVIKDDFYYVGSYSRWCFGETEPKGFMTVDYHDGKYKATFVENTLARTYKTITINDQTSFYKNSNVNSAIDDVHAIVSDMDTDYLRIIFDIPEDYDKSTLLINMVNEVFGKFPGIKIIINNNAKEVQKKRETEERAKELLNRYDFLFDGGISPEEKLSKYIEMKYNKTIPTDRVRDILYQKVSVEIKEEE